MKVKNILAVATLLTIAGAVPTVRFAEAKLAQNDANRLVRTPASDVKWQDLDPTGAPGVMIAPLWGDYTKGAFGAFLKLPAGFAAPLHTHSHDMNVVFLSGTYIQAPVGKQEFRLGTGSYMMQPGGDYRHTTSCDKTADCVFLIHSQGAFDLKAANPK